VAVVRGQYITVLVAFLVSLIGVALHYARRARRSAATSWEDLLKRLIWVNHDNIEAIALDVVDESGEPRPGDEGFLLDSSTIWTLLGGLDGLEALEHNCAVLVELAAYLQRWHPEAVVVAEQLRLNAREIDWHVGRLQGAAQNGNLQSSFADYAQRAVVTYYFMTRHVLELYDRTGESGLAELQRAL
jgi:hypothetical protein